MQIINILPLINQRVSIIVMMFPLKSVQITDIPKWPKGLNYLIIINHNLLQQVQRMQDWNERSCCLSRSMKSVPSVCVCVCVFNAFALMLTRGLMHARGGTWLAGMSMTGALYLSSVKKVISLLLSLCFSYTPHTLTLSVTRHAAPSCYVLLKRQSSRMALLWSQQRQAF